MSEKDKEERRVHARGTGVERAARPDAPGSGIAADEERRRMIAYERARGRLS